MKFEEEALYKGKPLVDCNKEELYNCIEYLYNYLNMVERQHDEFNELMKKHLHSPPLHEKII